MAGGGVVHVVGGFSGLVILLFTGKRFEKVTNLFSYFINLNIEKCNLTLIMMPFSW